MEQSDKALVSQYFAGDETALRFLVERHLRVVYNFILRFVGDVSDAEDVTQEVFVKAWKHLKKYNQDRNFRTWLMSIAHNTAIDFLRKKKSIPFSAFDTEDGGNVLTDMLADPAPLPTELLIVAENVERLEAVLKKLSPNSRVVLLLRYHNQHTFDEIGEILGKPLHTVKSQHRRALIQLRGFLSEV